MKAWFFLLCVCWSAAADACAQGTVYFISSTGFGAVPVFHSDCVTKLSGDAFRAQLYAGASRASEAELVAVGPAVPFKTGGGAGLWSGVVVSVPFVPPVERAVLQARVWETRAGSYEMAVALGLLRGASKPFEEVLGHPDIGLPANMNGLESFCLIPEPSTRVLGLFGAGLLLFLPRFRRALPRKA